MRWLRRRDPPPLGVHADPVGFPGVRFFSEDGEEALTRFVGELPTRPLAAHGDRLTVLALSGGGAGGAFGAGALVGLTKGGERPTFDMVTGVSTGALIAPFALLGPEWDGRLTDAYTDGEASELLALTGLRPGPSLYASEPLTNLVERYIDAALLEAVGLAHREGRRLFVATANLDAQAICIWDMGAIAARGGDAALRLFIDVLIASASLPGVFPPKMIAVESQGRQFEEMHVDGGTISPLFVVPEPLLLRKAEDWEGRTVEVYALINTTLHPEPRATPLMAVPILVNSFELMLRSSYRSALRSVAAFCEINDFTFYTAAVPPEFSGGSMLRFDQPLMARMFEHGVELGESKRLWSKPA
ncbi:MAG: patatin-like phospholipase family protein [Caulobacteraceae bacterium]